MNDEHHESMATHERYKLCMAQYHRMGPLHCNAQQSRVPRFVPISASSMSC